MSVIKFEPGRIHFLSDVFIAVALACVAGSKGVGDREEGIKEGATVAVVAAYAPY